VTRGSLCTKKHPGRAQHRFPKLLALLGLRSVDRGAYAVSAFRADAGSDPCVSMPVVASAEVGMCTPSRPPPWVATGPAIPCGKANGASLRPMGSSLKAGAAIGHVVSRSERDVTAHLEERQGAPGSLTEVEDEACAVAPSERQARPGGRGNVSAVVLDARPQRRANEPAVAAETDGRSDAVGGAREIGTAGRSRPCRTGTPARRAVS